MPDEAECQAPPCFWNSTVQKLADTNEWWSLFLLLVGRSHSANQSNRGIAHGCDASGVSIVAFLNHAKDLGPTQQLAMVKALLEVKMFVSFGSMSNAEIFTFTVSIPHT